MLKRVLLAAGLSWIFAVTLGLLFAACVSGRLSFSTLLLPGVIPVALIGSTLISILITPIAVWTLRTGRRNLYLYTPALWVALATYEVVAIPKIGIYGPYGLLVLAVVGLVILGLVPPSSDAVDSRTTSQQS